MPFWGKGVLGVGFGADVGLGGYLMKLSEPGGNAVVEMPRLMGGDCDGEDVGSVGVVKFKMRWWGKQAPKNYGMVCTTQAHSGNGKHDEYSIEG